MDQQQLRYALALQKVHKIGPVHAKNLIAYCGSPAEVFQQKKPHLLKIPGIGEKLVSNILSFTDFDAVDNELAFIEKHKIQVLYYLDEQYPRRLKDLNDAPVLLFYKGNADLNQQRVLGIVGTRKATDYGRQMCERLVEELAPYNPLIVSGLAFGIDTFAHRAALQYGLATVGAMGSGLDRIYPYENRGLAAKMVSNGGLLTEYFSGTKPEKEHFPARNRIVAGLIDGLVLIETARTGGALITGEIANSYNRDVLAYPGRVGDEYSGGCNHFIKVNKAVLIESAADVVYNLDWDRPDTQNPVTRTYSGLSEEEAAVINLLKEHGKMDVDGLHLATGYDISRISVLLLDMEFKGLIQALPGRFYRLH
jgi:DNA processing protein